MLSAFHSAASLLTVMAYTETHEENRAIVNIISKNCAFLTMTSPNAVKTLLK